MACRQLGFPGTVKATHDDGSYGNQPQTYHRYEINCTGLESNLTFCQHSETGVPVCGQNKDAGFMCYPKGKCHSIQDIGPRTPPCVSHCVNGILGISIQTATKM